MAYGTTAGRALDPPTVFASAAHGCPHGVAVAGGRTVYVSGQVAWDAERRLTAASSVRRSLPLAPASTWIGVTALAEPDLLIEVEAVAVVD